ncbi:MAG TPA: sigma-70 family RNA polymerase sigma factor [Blastocatellia bacterium]|nr:sigma-70 family RNA polymerase sigma factor [Blastocatellia bacterium]
MTETGTPPLDNVSQLLARWGSGDKAALDELVPIVYTELRRLARSHLRRIGGPQTLEPTALVHEAYVQLADQSSISFENRAQFFGLAAKVMRDILVDHARRRHAAKREGNQLQVSLSVADRIGNKPAVDLLALDLAMQRLAETGSEYSRVVELRFFGGLTIEETAEAMNLSHATVERYWSFARAWLRRELGS